MQYVFSFPYKNKPRRRSPGNIRKRLSVVLTLVLVLAVLTVLVLTVLLVVLVLLILVVLLVLIILVVLVGHYCFLLWSCAPKYIGFSPQ